MTWVNSPSPDLSHYIVSGREWDTAYERIGPIFGTGANFTRGDTGQYLMQVAAVSLGGVFSDWVTGGFLIDPSQRNPLGTLRQFSGVKLIGNVDPLYVDPIGGGYTGYVGTNPIFEWQVLHDSHGVPIVDKQFISGYRIDIRDFANTTSYITPFTVSGRNANRYEVTTAQMDSMPGGRQRGWDFRVDWVDIYGNTGLGANIEVNNPPMKPPFSSGFVGFNGGLIYNVTPSLQYDTSGIYVWMNRSDSFTPTYSNSDYDSTNLAGVAPNSFLTGNYWSWFSLIDTFGTGGNAIYGPISGDAAGVFKTFQFDISEEISGAFALLTGTFTNSLNIISGDNLLTLQAVNGLSGQIIGTTPGAANTALTVRVDTAVVNASGATASQIDAVSARVETTGNQLTATVGTLQSALATTGGALASWISNISASTTGQNASIQIGAQAFVTGDVNGIGGVAVATWGFKLDANNKVVSMEATSSSWGAGTEEFGTIVFGGANLQSENFVAGSDGWQIQGNGNVEFGDAVIRGSFTGGQGSDIVSMDSNGFMIGDPVGDRVEIIAPSLRRAQTFYNANGNPTVSLGTYDNPSGPIDIGIISLFAGAGGGTTIDLNGTVGNAIFQGTGRFGGLRVGPSDENLRFMARNDGLISGNSFLDLGGNSAILGDSSKFGGVRYSGGTTNVIGFWWDGSNARVMVDGILQGTIPNP